MVLVTSSTTATRCGPTLKLTLLSMLPIILLPKSTPNSFMSTVTWLPDAQKVSGRMRTRRSEYHRQATAWPEDAVTVTAFSMASLFRTGSENTISIGWPEPTVDPFCGYTAASASFALATVVNVCVFLVSRPARSTTVKAYA